MKNKTATTVSLLVIVLMLCFRVGSASAQTAGGSSCGVSVKIVQFEYKGRSGLKDQFSVAWEFNQPSLAGVPPSCVEVLGFKVTVNVTRENGNVVTETLNKDKFARTALVEVSVGLSAHKSAQLVVQADTRVKASETAERSILTGDAARSLGTDECFDGKVKVKDITLEGSSGVGDRRKRFGIVWDFTPLSEVSCAQLEGFKVDAKIISSTRSTNSEERTVGKFDRATAIEVIDPVIANDPSLFVRVHVTALLKVTASDTKTISL
ncbi:MAG: hypothetical protein DMF69_08945 [Acidobacteria bacterium]|nr:MAG: hypothetical protein DMF69_08945 [Acidobacteriota bacterium]